MPPHLKCFALRCWVRHATLQVTTIGEPGKPGSLQMPRLPIIGKELSVSASGGLLGYTLGREALTVKVARIYGSEHTSTNNPSSYQPPLLSALSRLKISGTTVLYTTLRLSILKRYKF